MFHKTALVLVVFSIFAPLAANAVELPTPAEPAKEFNCTLETTLASRPLFLNAGVYASTKGAAQTFDLYCQHASGFYGDIWNLTPFRNFGDGGEVDLRGGWNKKFGAFGVDVSGAWYNFRVDGLGVFNNANARGKLSYDFDLAPNVVLQVYGMLDYQRSFDLVSPNAFAVVGGVYAGYKVFPQLEVGVGGEVWKYTTHWASNKNATVYSVVPQVKYAVDKNTSVFGKAAFATGTVLDPLDHKGRVSYQAGLSFSF